jgi:hypothetical protein
MQGSTPQEKLFESMKGPVMGGADQAKFVYEQSKNRPDYQKWSRDKFGKARDLTEPMTQMQKDAFGLMSGYAGAGGRGQQLAQSAESAMQEALGGGTGFTGGQEQDILAGRVPMGAGTPYQDMADAFQQQSQRGLQDTMAGIRQGMVQAQPGGGSVGNQIQARALAENQENINSQLAQMYGGAYKMAQDQRRPMAELMAQQQRAGMQAYPDISQQPMNLYGQMAQGGEQMRGIGGEARAADIAAYQARGAQPGLRLQEYLSNLGSLGGTATGIAGLLG